MDESQNFNIPLDSPLDINKSDMLVNVRQPKFSFNRQKLLGGVLQTSVRYEDDGYFAGWWRHNFDLISIGDNSIRPNLYGLDDVEDLPQIIELEARNLVIHNRDFSWCSFFMYYKKDRQASSFHSLLKTGRTGLLGFL